MKYLLIIFLLSGVLTGQVQTLGFGGAIEIDSNTDVTIPNDFAVTGAFDPGTNLSLPLSFSLKGSLPTPAFLLGVNDDIATGLTTTDGTERVLGNNHLRITVNSITGSDVVVVTGDKVSESSGAVTLGTTENITIDATGDYQTDAKWWRVSAVTIPGGITDINYDLGRLGYWDNGNEDFRIIGYRFEISPTNITAIDFQLQIYKIEDNTAKKLTIVTMEDISISGTTAWIVDTKRSARDYTTASATQFKVDVPNVLKMTDFESYFSSDENILEGEAKNEGIILKITWDSADFMSGMLFYKNGTGL